MRNFCQCYLVVAEERFLSECSTSTTEARTLRPPLPAAQIATPVGFQWGSRVPPCTPGAPLKSREGVSISSSAETRSSELQHIAPARCPPPTPLRSKTPIRRRPV